VLLEERALPDLTNAERSAVEAIIAHLPDDQRRRFLTELQQAAVEVVNEDRSMLRFKVHGQSALPGQQSIWPEAKVQDADGEILDVVLYQDANGCLLEMELVRYANGSVRSPDWSTLKVCS
jgi:hypothetical protein